MKAITPNLLVVLSLLIISSTYWTERIGPAAALATIEKHRDHEVAGHLVRVGKAVQAGWQSAADRSGLEIEVGGIPPLAHFGFQCEDAQAAHTLFTQTMLDRGFLATKGFYATYAHEDDQIDDYLGAVDDTFELVASAVEGGTLREALRGPVAHAGFRRLT